jgi:Uma2 family endonuclease
MPVEVPRQLLAIRYYEEAQLYLRSLPLEHFMEATPQATQRKITLASLEIIASRRSDFQLFNELLVQYPLPRQKRPGQVVPDNMVVIHDKPIDADGSYDVPLQPVGPYWVLEYVSKSNRRKDYDDNMRKYEHELKVPYYLLFAPDVQEVTLYRHSGRKYKSVKPNEHGRYALPELEIEVALVDGWVRFWFQGEMLSLPGEMDQALREARETAAKANARADELARELAELRAKLKNGKNGKS